MITRDPSTVLAQDKQPPSRCTKLKLFCTQIIDPDNEFRTNWDSAFFFIMAFQLIEIPLQVGFEMNADPWSGLGILELCLDVYFLIDCALNFRTGFYRENKLVKDPKLIAS